MAFHYFDLDEKGERVFRTNNVGEPKRYYVEPVALVFNEDNYYLVTYSSRHPDKTANYRVDRMEHVEVVEESVLSDEATTKIDTIAHTQSKHSRCKGEPERVVLSSKNGHRTRVDVRRETQLLPSADNKLLATVDVQVSKTFFAAGTVRIREKIIAGQRRINTRIILQKYYREENRMAKAQ